MTPLINVSALNGLAIYPSAPADSQAVCKLADPLTKTTTIEGWTRLIALVASSPPIIGMETSMITTSGRSSAANATASSPLWADPITSMPWLEERARHMKFKTASESSTISARILVLAGSCNVIPKYLSVRVG